MYRLIACVTVLLSLFCADALQAFPIAAPGTEGLKIIVSSDKDVIATFQGHSATYSDDLYIVLADGSSKHIFNNQTSAVGSKKYLGPFDVGTELQFRLRVNDTGHVYYTGPAERNPDHLAHARVQGGWGSAHETLVSFEDLFGTPEGTYGYNDLSFSLTNVTTSAHLSPPTNLRQIRLIQMDREAEQTIEKEIPAGEWSDESTVFLRAEVSCPKKGVQVRLQAELRRLGEYDGRFNDTKAEELHTSDPGRAGEVTLRVDGLIEAKYHWRARTVPADGDTANAPSDWVEFPEDKPNSTPDTDFSIPFRGIDVSSSGQARDIDWVDVYQAGYKFAYARASWGDENKPVFVDDTFGDNMARGCAAGLKMGAYHVAYPERTVAASEARHFLNEAGNYVGTGYLPPALDLEDDRDSKSYPSSLGWGTLTAWVLEWMHTVEEAGEDVKPILYTTRDYAEKLDPNTVGPSGKHVTDYGLWIADPNKDAKCDVNHRPDTGRWPTWDFWQYWVGKVQEQEICGPRWVDGVDAWVDIDLMNPDSSAVALLWPTPIAYWSFREGGGAVADDEAGSNPGRVYGAKWVDGPIGKALWFDGIDDYVDCGHAPGLAPERMTVAFWMFMEGRTSYQYILGEAESMFLERDYTFSTGGDGKLEFAFGESFYEQVALRSKEPVPLGQWVHVAATRGGATASLYLNGQLENSTAYLFVPTSKDQSLRIGSIGLPEPEWAGFFKGELDDVRIYDKALSAEEIQKLYGQQ